MTETCDIEGIGHPAWKGRAILLVDLDAFFASVEQLDHPEWRGKPVIVGGDPDKRGVVSTCSYEARKAGVHSAQAAATARRLCPEAIWTHGNYDRYSEMSGKVMDILLDESPRMQQVSIDEAFLDVTPGRYLGEDPVIIASRIQQRVQNLGITCSIGVGTSKTVAKIASDMDKPRGITVVYPGTEEGFLSPLPTRRLSGIGTRSAARLGVAGIRTLGEVADGDETLLRDVFGVNAPIVRNRCRGVDDDPVVTEREVKSVSNEMTFSTDITDRTEIEQAVMMLGAKVGRRLRRKGLAGGNITLKLKYDDLSVRTARGPLPFQTDNEKIFVPVAYSLIGKLYEPGMRVRLIGVGISGFGDAGYQLDLLSDDELEQNELDSRLAAATDRVRERFGDEAVGYGRELRLKDKGTNTAPQHKDEVT